MNLDFDVSYKKTSQVVERPLGSLTPPVEKVIFLKSLVQHEQ